MYGNETCKLPLDEILSTEEQAPVSKSDKTPYRKTVLISKTSWLDT